MGFRNSSKLFKNVKSCANRLRACSIMVCLVGNIPQSAVETFDESVLGGLSGPDECQLDVVFLCPSIHDLAGEFGTVAANSFSRSRSAVWGARRCLYRTPPPIKH